MPTVLQTQVLIAGAGPIGLAAAIDLTRRGVDCRIVDPLLEPPQYAKAVGVQPRTLEVFEAMGVLDRILDAAGIAHRHMTVYLIGAPGADVVSTVLPLVRDTGSEFARAYSTTGDSAFVVRPDGYLGFAGSEADIDGLVAHLRATFDWLR